MMRIANRFIEPSKTDALGQRGLMAQVVLQPGLGSNDYIAKLEVHFWKG
jgi:hypothetical protein